FHLEAGTERVGDVARGTAKAQHRVLFVRLVAGAADQVGIFVGFEIGQTHDDGLRREGRGDRGYALGQPLDEEFARVRVSRNQGLYDRFELGRQGVVFEQRAGVD